MSDDGPNLPGVEELPEIAVEKRGGIPIVWLIPLAAALIGVWLAYKTITEMGPTITITFKDGAGLEAGKTQVKYKAVEIGVVETVDISEDLSHVIVTANLSKGANAHLHENTRFWVVRPRIGFSGISGLETLISGAYIEIDPGVGVETRMTFEGLDRPPGVAALEAGGHYRLRAQTLGSLHAGAPVYFRDFAVGRVLDNELAKDGQSILLDIFIEAPHHLRLRNTSRFWKTSGLEVSAGTEGFKVKVGSLATLLSGGIAFDSPVTAAGGTKPSKSGRLFELFESFASIGESAYTRKVPYLIYFDGSVRGLSIGAPVEFRGIKVGSVTDIAVDIDPKTLDVRIPVAIEMEPERVVSMEFIESRKPYEAFGVLVERGLRAQLQTGSLLTGQLLVVLEFHPDLPKKQLVRTGKYPEIPTVPATMDELRRTVTDVMAEVRRLPLDKIGQELLGTLKGTNKFANSPELAKSLRNLNATLEDVQSLAASTEKTLAAARGALQVLDANSPAAVNLADALAELASAARAIRVLADYLERHPEAVLVGKRGPGG